MQQSFSAEIIGVAAKPGLCVEVEVGVGVESPASSKLPPFYFQGFGIRAGDVPVTTLLHSSSGVAVP